MGMKVYRHDDASLDRLQGRQIAVIGYGNQGRAQALNLRDSGLDVMIGNRKDEYRDRAQSDGFAVRSIAEAASKADVVMLLIPDEVMPEVLDGQIVPGLDDGDVLVFASGYNIAFGQLTVPEHVDVVLLAPRMIGAGVRDKYVAGSGFPSFIAVHQDRSGQAKETVLALAKGIGSTRFGVVEVTFAQEAELDLYTEQCFGPAFGQVLTTSVDLLVEHGYPPEAVLLELYMSGELAYTMAKIAEMGLVEQSQLHSTTSQYGSMSRGMRFILPELRERLQQGLDEIHSGQFAEEWRAEQEAGCPTLQMLRESARSLPLYRLEQQLRHALRGEPIPAELIESAETPVGQVLAEPMVSPELSTASAAGPGLLSSVLSTLRGLLAPAPAATPSGSLSRQQLERVLRRFCTLVAEDSALQAFSRGRRFTSHYVLGDAGLDFYMRFADGVVESALGVPVPAAEVRLETTADVLDGMLSGRLNAMRAAMSGKLQFKGEAKVAMSQQQVQADLVRLYLQARGEIVGTDA
jgi:ketol-acid reductoisomerase